MGSDDEWVATIRQRAQCMLAHGPSFYKTRIEAGPKFKTVVRIRNAVTKNDPLADADTEELLGLLDALLKGVDVRPLILHKARGRPPATYAAVFVALDCKLRGRGHGAEVQRDWNLTEDQLRRLRLKGNAEAQWWMVNNDRQCNLDNVAGARRRYLKRRRSK